MGAVERGKEESRECKNGVMERNKLSIQEEPKEEGGGGERWKYKILLLLLLFFLKFFLYICHDFFPRSFIFPAPQTGRLVREGIMKEYSVIYFKFFLNLGFSYVKRRDF